MLGGCCFCNSLRLKLMRRRPGCAPGGAVPFFVSPKKGDPTCRVPSLRCGQPAMLAGKALPQNSLRACSASLRQLRQIRARSVGILRCPRAPHPLRFSARPEGIEARHGPSLRLALGTHTASRWPYQLPTPARRAAVRECPADLRRITVQVAAEQATPANAVSTSRAGSWRCPPPAAQREGAAEPAARGVNSSFRVSGSRA